jgi:TonB family protein
MNNSFTESGSAPGQAALRQTEPFPFLLTAAPLPVRLWREIIQASEAFRQNPREFIRAIIKGDGITRQRLELLQSGAAFAVMGYSLVFVLLTLLGMHRATQAEIVRPETDRPLWEVIPMPRKNTRAAHHSANKNSRAAEPAAGGSSKTRQEPGGGGGSGSNESPPASHGVLPPLLPRPPIVLANVRPKIENSSLIVIPNVVGDDQAVAPRPGVFGDPSSKATPLSNGPGQGDSIGASKGLGVGDGNGDGALKGNGNNIGGDSPRKGCCGPGGAEGGGVELHPSTRPIILYKEKAQYTEEARENRIMGTVVLSAVFGPDGEIYDIRPVRQLPHGLTEEAIKAMRKIRFRPGTKNGVPVSVRMNIEFSFNIF